MEKKSISLKIVIKIITFHVSFVLEAYIIPDRVDTEEVSFKEMCRNFQLIMTLLINLTF